MSYDKPSIRAIEHQTEIAGCTPCDGGATAQLFNSAGLGQVYARVFGRPCPTPPGLGPIEFCVTVSDGSICGQFQPPTLGSVGTIGSGVGELITLP